MSTDPQNPDAPRDDVPPEELQAPYEPTQPPPYEPPPYEPAQPPPYAYGEAPPPYGPPQPAPYAQPGYPPPYGTSWQGYSDPEAKSKLAAGLFGIFLGALGIHRFYLGYTGIGLAQLLITVLSCGLLSWVSAIWGLVEGILYLSGASGWTTDARGRPLKD